jgi:hypothetical protein
MTIMEFNPYVQPGDSGYVKFGIREDCGSVAKVDRAEYGCTLDEGHDGPHVAHGVYDQMIARWTD